MMKKYTVILSIFLSCISIAFAQTVGITDAVKKEIKSRVDQGTYPSLVVGYIDATGISYYAYGNKSLDTTSPVDENTIYEIGSISKTFTGLLLADAVEQGVVALEDPLQKYLPKGVSSPTYENTEITLVSLSNHTSSLPRMPDNFDSADPNNPYVDYSAAQMYAFLNDTNIVEPVGSRASYSNYGQGLLGYTLASIQGEDYESLLRKEITKPFKMKNTAVSFSKAMRTNLALPYDNQKKAYNWDIISLAGAGGIRSSTKDMMTYLSYMMGMKKTAKASAIQRTQKRTTKEDLPSIGLAWFIEETSSGKTLYQHGGATGGYRAFAAFIPEEQRGVVLFTNCTQGPEDIAYTILDPKAHPLKHKKPSLSVAIQTTLDKEGPLRAEEQFRSLKDSEDYDLDESELNSVGYGYMEAKKYEKALAIFTMNIAAFPKSSNVYDSAGEAYEALGQTNNAIANYSYSLALNPNSITAKEYLNEKGVDTSVFDHVKEDEGIEVSSEILETYVGKYALAPNFNLEITTKDGKLFAQATGQGKYELFANSNTEFYLKVVEAKVTFSPNDDGTVSKLVLHQNGRDMPAKRI